MRIVHAVRSDGFAGVERHVAGLARAQAAAGHQVCVIGGDPRSMATAVDNQGVVLQPAATVPQVASALRRMAPGSDVVHVHMTAAEVAATVAASTSTPWPVRAWSPVRQHSWRGSAPPSSAATARRGARRSTRRASVPTCMPKHWAFACGASSASARAAYGSGRVPAQATRRRRTSTCRTGATLRPTEPALVGEPMKEHLATDDGHGGQQPIHPPGGMARV